MDSLAILTRAGAVAVPIVAQRGPFAVCPLPGRPHHWCIARPNGNVVLRSSSLAGLLAALPLLADGVRIGRVCAVVWAHERTEKHGLSRARLGQQRAATAAYSPLVGTTAIALLTPTPLNPYQTDREEGEAP